MVLAISSFRYLLLFHFDDMFQPVHLGHLQVYICTNMLESTTARKRPLRHVQTRSRLMNFRASLMCKFGELLLLTFNSLYMP